MHKRQTQPLRTLHLTALMLVGCVSGQTTNAPDIQSGTYVVEVDQSASLATCSNQASGSAPTSLIFYNYVPGEGSPGYYFPAEAYPAYEGVESTAVGLDCNMGTSEFEDLGFRCIGTVPGGWRPDASMEASWPVQLKIEGRWHQHLVCADDADDGSPLWAAFDDGEWTLSVAGPCEGSDCPQATWTEGEECVHGVAISARFAGCDDGTGTGQCINDGAQVDCAQ